MKEKRGGKGTQSERVLCKFLRQGAGGLGGGGISYISVNAAAFLD